MKAKTMFYCTECGNELPKWAGQCPACKAWNTIVEQPADTKRKSPAASAAPARHGAARPRRMEEVETTEELRFATGPPWGGPAPADGGGGDHRRAAVRHRHE